MTEHSTSGRVWAEGLEQGGTIHHKSLPRLKLTIDDNTAISTPMLDLLEQAMDAAVAAEAETYMVERGLM